MSRLLLSALVVLGVGCAGSGGAVRTHSDVVRLGAEDREPLVMVGHEITGPGTSLRLKDDTLVGTYAGAPTSLQVTDEVVAGTIGIGNTQLNLIPSGEDATLTHIQGSFAGRPVDLRLRGPWLMGRFDQCTYDTEHTSQGFVGLRTCYGRTEEQVRVHFPDALSERPFREQMALLALALACDSYRDPNSAYAISNNRPDSIRPYKVLPVPDQRPEGGAIIRRVISRPPVTQPPATKPPAE